VQARAPPRQRRLINRPGQGFAQASQSWYFLRMEAGRIASAVQRIEAAMERIAAAREAVLAQASQQAAGSTRVVELVNKHERLREQVAESLRELDDLIDKLEE